MCTREHLAGAMALFAAEGWQTYTAERERTFRGLAAPGSTSIVAVDDGAVVALIQLQSDGEIQAHLSALVVAEGWRRRGLARRLLREALRRAGGLRIDLITRSGDFYLGLGGRPGPGFRLTREGLGLADRATPLDHPISVTGGHHPSDRAAMRGRQYMDAAIEQTGAVVMGRRTFEMGDPDSYERLRLEKLEVHEIGARTSLGFRILDR